MFTKNGMITRAIIAFNIIFENRAIFLFLEDCHAVLLDAPKTKRHASKHAPMQCNARNIFPMKWYAVLVDMPRDNMYTLNVERKTCIKPNSGSDDGGALQQHFSSLLMTLSFLHYITKVMILLYLAN